MASINVDYMRPKFEMNKRLIIIKLNTSVQQGNV